MSIVVINYSGNVGKTTIVQHVLRPRFANGAGKVISVESVNEDMESDAKVRAERFRAIIDELELNDSLIVDVGASNAEVFLQRMRQSEGSHEAISKFVIPVSTEIKQQRDTIQTVMALNDLGVPAERIHLILNKLPPGEDAESVYSRVIAFVESEKMCVLSLDAIVGSNEIFDLLRDPCLMGMSIEALAQESPDEWRQKLRETESEEEKRPILNRISAIRLAKPVQRALDGVYAAIE